jgi:hypothetical protein
MNRDERLDYIFGNHKNEYIANRFGWIDALLSDIRTLIDGGQGFVKGEIKPMLEGSHGAGNVSIPMLVCTGLELVSALYTGNKHRARDNVKKFVEAFFPDDGKKISAILWQGIRNGTNHAFIPNTITVSTNRVVFSFFVSHALDNTSYITKSNDELTLNINSIQFYHILKEAICEYKSKLESEDSLQLNFIDGWESKRKPDDRTQDLSIDTEVKYLLEKLGDLNQSSLFV